MKTKNSKKPDYVFYSPQIITLLIGINLIFIFFVIYLIIAIMTNHLDFYSFFFHNISKNVFKTILTGFHASMLGGGILLILIAFFNMTPKVYCYKDKFIISMYLQKKSVVPYEILKKCDVKIYYLNYENLFKKYPKKECRVIFNNPIYSFYLSYPVEGYFDDIEIFFKDSENNMTERCVCKRKHIHAILNQIKTKSDLNIPFLPDEADKKIYF